MAATATPAAPAPAAPKSEAAPAPTPEPQSRHADRTYTVYRETENGIEVVQESVTAKTQEDACWAVVEGKLKAEAEKAGKGDAKGPRLAAQSGGLRFEEYVLEPVSTTKRVKR